MDDAFEFSEVANRADLVLQFQLLYIVIYGTDPGLPPRKACAKLDKIFRFSASPLYPCR